jgi:hypothetical protein
MNTIRIPLPKLDVTVEGLQAFLQANLKRQFDPNDPEKCPFACWLSEREGRRITVSCYAIIDMEAPGFNTYHACPEWASNIQTQWMEACNYGELLDGADCFFILTGREAQA